MPWRPTSGLLFELDVRRCFRSVCRARGLAGKDRRGDLTVFPLLSKVRGTRDGFTVKVRPLLGQTMGEWERAAPAFALAFGVSATRLRNEGDGTFTMPVGYQRLDAHEFQPGAVEPSPAISWRDHLARVQVGHAEGGTAYGMPLIDSHTLVAGETGAGKGSLIWSLILGLEPAHRAGVVRFWGFDPKRMELSIGRGFFGERYAADPEAMVLLLEAAHDEMQRRADELAGVVRRFEPSSAHPLHVLVVDELGYLSALLPDRKLRDRAENALSGVLVLGRAVGFVVIGALQDPRKETLSFRDLFPTRVAMRLTKPMVDLVLGNGMYEAGAQCDLIPVGNAGAGVAFVKDESSTLPVCVRMSWCADEAIRAAAGRLTAGPSASWLAAPIPT